MPQREPGQDDPAQGPRGQAHGSLRFPLGMSRTKSMGAGGLAAASIGWVMVGCTAFGFGVGLWLDKKFGTGFLMPILTFVGIAAGFREMFSTLSQLSKQPQQARSQGARPSLSVASSSQKPGEPKLSELRPSRNDLEAGEVPRQRLFQVPPPPFMEQPGVPLSTQKLDSAEITRRLLGIEEDGRGGEEKSDAV